MFSARSGTDVARVLSALAQIITSLEGFECGSTDQHERKSDDVSVCPPVR
jgi:hypothetical protein